MSLQFRKLKELFETKAADIDTVCGILNTMRNKQAVLERTLERQTCLIDEQIARFDNLRQENKKLSSQLEDAKQEIAKMKRASLAEKASNEITRKSLEASIKFLKDELECSKEE